MRRAGLAGSSAGIEPGKALISILIGVPICEYMGKVLDFGYWMWDLGCCIQKVY